MKKIAKNLLSLVLAMVISVCLCACDFLFIDLGTKTTVQTNKLPQSEATRMPESDYSPDDGSQNSGQTPQDGYISVGNSSAGNNQAGNSSVGNGSEFDETEETEITKVVKVNISDYEVGNNDVHPIEYAIADLKIKAIANSDTRYVLNLKKTTYKFDRTLQLTNCRNIEINGNGAKFIWTEDITAIEIKECTNLKLTNISMDYDPLNFLQGVITKVNGDVFNVKLDAGYPTWSEIFTADKETTFQLHDAKTGAVKLNSKDTYYLDSCTEVSKTEVQAKLTYTYNDSRMPQVGDSITLWQSKTRTVTINDSKQTTFENFNMYNAGFGVYEENGYGGSKFINCKFVPGAKPSGATKERLRFSTRDATHFACLENGPTFDSCTITHCGDDCINVHGFFYYVAKIEGNKVTMHGKYGNRLEEGDTVVAYTKGDYEQLGTAKVTSFKSMRDDSVESIVQSFYQESGNTAGSLPFYWVQVITLDKPISGLKVGDTIVPTTRQGNGTVVKNCTLGYNRARAILVKGQNAVIENNTITSCTGAGILLWQEVSWQEGGFISDLAVRNNTIKDCLRSFDSRYGASNVDSYGAITLGISRVSDGKFRKCYENKNITIESNTIENCGGYGIFAINATNLNIKNNTIKNPFTGGINSVGAVFGLTPKSGIVIGQANTVYTVGNKVVSDNSAITKAVEFLLNCTDTHSTGDSLN